MSEPSETRVTESTGRVDQIVPPVMVGVNLYIEPPEELELRTLRISTLALSMLSTQLILLKSVGAEPWQFPLFLSTLLIFVITWALNPNQPKLVWRSCRPLLIIIPWITEFGFEIALLIKSIIDLRSRGPDVLNILNLIATSHGTTVNLINIGYLLFRTRRINRQEREPLYIRAILGSQWLFTGHAVLSTIIYFINFQNSDIPMRYCIGLLVGTVSSLGLQYVIHNPGSVNPVLAEIAKDEGCRKVAGTIYLLMVISLISDMIDWSKYLEDLKEYFLPSKADS